jgi:hypothetical protein
MAAGQSAGRQRASRPTPAFCRVPSACLLLSRPSRNLSCPWDVHLEEIRPKWFPPPAPSLLLSHPPLQPSRGEGALWVEQWVSSAKQLNQWDALAEYAGAADNNALLADAYWRLSEWDRLRDILVGRGAQGGRGGAARRSRAPPVSGVEQGIG